MQKRMAQRIKGNIRMIALDMDGTLLNSQKEISRENRLAVQEAADRGITVVYATGRAVCEMEEFFDQLPEVRYAVFASGGGLYDIRRKRAFGLKPIPADLTGMVLNAAKDRDIMPQIVLENCDAVQQDHLKRLEDFHMGVYRPMYERAMTRVKDIQAFGREHLGEALKINLYHTGTAERDRTLSLLTALQIEKVYSEVTSLECSAKGVNKGTGLAALCEFLEIEPCECAAVGDAANDLPMLRLAGLGVAMGNAKEGIREKADRIVADNDHDGCAEAIRMACYG